MMRNDMEFDYMLSWTGYKWDLGLESNKYTEENLGYFTSRIPILDQKGESEEFSIYIMDSGSFDCGSESVPGTTCISPDAIDWFINQQVSYSHTFKSRDFVFTNRPLQEYMHMANHYNVTG